MRRYGARMPTPREIAVATSVAIESRQHVLPRFTDALEPAAGELSRPWVQMMVTVMRQGFTGGSYGLHSIDYLTHRALHAADRVQKHRGQYSDAKFIHGSKEREICVHGHRHVMNLISAELQAFLDEQDGPLMKAALMDALTAIVDRPEEILRDELLELFAQPDSTGPLLVRA